MATAETEQLRTISEQQIDVARQKLEAHGIVRLAVMGPAGSAGETLANELGVTEIELHDDYSSVLKASEQQGVGSVMPCHTVEGKDKGTGKNLSTLLKAGRALIACMDQPVEDSVVHTKIVISPKSNSMGPVCNS